MYGPLKKKSMSYWVPFLRFQFWFRIQTLLVQNLKFRKLHSQCLRRNSVIGLFLHWLNISGTFLKQFRLFSNWQNSKILIGCKVTRLDEFFGPRILSWIESRLKYFLWVGTLLVLCSVLRHRSKSAKVENFFRNFQELFISSEKFILAFKNFYPSF